MISMETTCLKCRAISRIFVLFALLLPLSSLAQITVSGKVFNHADGRPLPNVSVFLSNATIGDNTNNDGAFTLHNVKPGKYSLVISIVGFETYTQEIVVNSSIVLPGIYLSPKAIALSEVKITPNDDPNRERNFEWFRDEFLGTSQLAKECKILNPELLDFKYNEDTKTLTASSVDFLIIENRALGYKIRYLLSEFTLNNDDEKNKIIGYAGYVLFEELKGTVSESEQWKKRRQEVYDGSAMHFLRAVVKNDIGAEGFRVLSVPLNPDRPADSLIEQKINFYTALKKDKQYHDSLSYWTKKLRLPKLLSKSAPQPLTKSDILSTTDKQGIFALKSNNNALFISYDNHHHFNSGNVNSVYDKYNTSNSLVFFNNKFALFDNNGTLINPKSLTINGLWANERLADLLPLDYEPGQKAMPIIDSAFIKKITAGIDAYRNRHAIEKTYLHFDKPYYAAGDTIYFKAYLTIGPYHNLSALSGILNVDLIDINNHLRKSLRLNLVDGVAWGDFALQDTIKAGNYRVRAYTNWMRNAGEAYFFDKNIPVVSSIPEQEKTRKANNNLSALNKTSFLKSNVVNQAAIQFFPEGGTLINGVPSKIAFKAIASNGLGTDVKGNVVDNEGHEVSTFTAGHLGMGVIQLTPQAGKSYKANITYADSSKVSMELPKAGDSGYAISIDDPDGDNLNVKILSGRQNQSGKVELVAQSGGVIYYYTEVGFVNNSFNQTIAKSIFPTGIVQFTLFSKAGDPLNERLVFVQHADQLKLNISTQQQSYAARQKVKIALNALNKNANPATGTFSVAIIDETRMPVNENTESTIFSNLLLTSDIRGYIEQPNYYFTNVNTKTRAGLDLLMLTQGYHRFEWRQVLGGQSPPDSYQPEKETSISGTIKNEWSKPMPGAKVSLLSTSRNFFLSLDTIADANGKFMFKNLPNRDSVRYVVQATEKKLRNSTLIKIDSLESAVGKNKNSADTSISEDRSAYLQNSNNFHKEQIKQGFGNNHAIELKQVVINEKKKPLKYLEYSSNLRGPGNADQVITADKLPLGCPTFTDCMTGRLTGVEFVKGKPFMTRERDIAMLVILDGQELYTGPTSSMIPGGGSKGGSSAPPPSPGANALDGINMNDIASIEVLRNASSAGVYGVRGAGGVIIITTKRFGDDTYSNGPAKGVAAYTPAGFYKARVFYSPQYNVQKTGSGTDLRTTIYWNPNIITGKDGNASFEYFNADGKGKYRVVVEGIDGDGNLGRGVFDYKVE